MPKVDKDFATPLSHPNLFPTYPLGEVATLLALICLFAAEPVPGVNESHYLPKAKHLFDATFCPGDVFIESHDSHGLAALVGGVFAQFLPLSVVAWLGRAICWISLAFAWQRLRIALQLSWLLGAAALASWYLAIDYGNWAGEWAIGGFEGKALAYVCVILDFPSFLKETGLVFGVGLGSLLLGIRLLVDGLVCQLDSPGWPCRISSNEFGLSGFGLPLQPRWDWSVSSQLPWG